MWMLTYLKKGQAFETGCKETKKLLFNVLYLMRFYKVFNIADANGTLISNVQISMQAIRIAGNPYCLQFKYECYERIFTTFA